MRHHRILTASAVLTLSLVVALPTVWATPGSGVLAEPLVTSTVPDGLDAKSRTGGWKASLDIKGSTDVRTVKYTVAPGGTFGWHSHPGPTIVVIKQGTLTYLDSETCESTHYPPGTAFVDDGNHTHNAFNHGAVELVFYATHLMPTGMPTRIDEPAADC